MKKKFIPLGLCLLGACAMILPNVLTRPNSKATVLEDDPISYANAEDAVVEYSGMKPISYLGDNGDLKIPNKLTLHYINDDQECESRRFYTWVTGYDGVERKPDEADAESMKITLDFNVITEYDGMPSLFFIIKKAGTWSGQSEDVELKYEDYQDCIDASLTLELWTIPGEGSSIEFCKSEEETKIPKIATAKFTDWKTIHCVSSDPTLKPKWYKVYAFDKTYLNSSQTAQINNKDFYLFKEGVPTTSEFDIKFNYTAKINIQYLIESVYPGYEDKPVRKIFASFEYLYKTSTFANYYNYTGDDLGMTYTATQTTFKVCHQSLPI